MYVVYIEMPSGCSSREHEFIDLEEAAKLSANYAIQMRAWPAFEAQVITRQHEPHEPVRIIDTKRVKT